MATIWSPAFNPPAAATYEGSSQLGGAHIGADGDIWVRSNGQQQRFRSASNGGPSWTIIVQPQSPTGDTRADVVPFGGQENDRLAKTGDNHFDLGWANASAGVVRELALDPATPDSDVLISGPDNNIFDLSHRLGSPNGVVSVTVVSTTDGINEIPIIEYLGPQECRLTFAVDVTPAIAVVRR